MHPTPDQLDGISVYDLGHLLWKARRLLAAVVGAAGALAVVVALKLPVSFCADTTIMVHGNSNSGGLAMVAAQVLGGGLGTSNGVTQKLIGLLDSRKLAEKVIDKLQLQPELFPQWEKMQATGKIPSMGQATQTLRQRMIVAEDKRAGVIRIQAEASTPALAVDIANTYVAELQAVVMADTYTQAKRYRKFIEERLERNRQDFLEAGKVLNAFYRDKGISSVDSRIDVDINDLSQSTTHDKTAGEVPKNIDELSRQKAALEEKLKRARIVSDVPQQVYLQYLTLHRQLLGQINSLLAREYEMAKIEEAKEELAFEVVDVAIRPDNKYKPKRSMIVVSAVLVSGLLAMLAVIARHHIRNATAG